MKFFGLSCSNLVLQKWIWSNLSYRTSLYVHCIDKMMLQHYMWEPGCGEHVGRWLVRLLQCGEGQWAGRGGGDWDCLVGLSVDWALKTFDAGPWIFLTWFLFCHLSWPHQVKFESIDDGPSYSFSSSCPAHSAVSAWSHGREFYFRYQN